MTLEECKTCEHNERFENGAVYCGFEQNIVSMVSVFNPKLNAYIMLSCPKERNN
jgi:hypothetical protein